MFGIKRKLEKLRFEFEQYKYDQANLPKYAVGQKLSDGTVITKVEKNEFLGSNFLNKPYVSYRWCYEGIRNGVIVNEEMFNHTNINKSDFDKLNELIKKQGNSIDIQNQTIDKLQWQIENPPKYKVGQKVKQYGECKSIDVIYALKGIIGRPFGHDLMNLPDYYYKYTFTKNNQTITICDTK